MRTFTLDQYKRMSEKFNKMDFRGKLKVLQENSDILSLANDYNWWWVVVKDAEIHEALDDEGVHFEIPHEWGFEEMHTLITMIGGIDAVGC